MSPARWVLALGLAAGLLLTFVTPPFEVPDEPAHFFHIYQIATGAPLEPGPGGAMGFWLPASLQRLVATSRVDEVAGRAERRLPPGVLGDCWRLPLLPEQRQFLPAGILTPYSPVAYLPAAAAVAAGQLAGWRPLVLLYLARLANLAAALAISWAAVRCAPAQRWLLALLALTPMALFERSSAGADALTNALGLLVVSLLLTLALRRVAWEEARVPAAAAERGRRAGGQPVDERSVAEPNGGGPHAGWVLVAGLALAAAKGAYFLMDLLVLLVPASALGRVRRTALLWVGGVAAAVAGAGLGWWMTRRSVTYPPPRSGLQPMVQLRTTVAAPLHFAGLAAADYLHHALRYAADLVGNFGWLDTQLPHLALGLWALLLLAAALTGGDPGLGLAGWQRWIAAAATAGTLLVLSLSLYLTWTRPGAEIIAGLQGRYYLPLAPVGALLFYNRRLAGPAPGTRPGLVRDRICAGLSAAFVALTLLRIWFRYHGSD